MLTDILLAVLFVDLLLNLIGCEILGKREEAQVAVLTHGVEQRDGLLGIGGLLTFCRDVVGIGHANDRIAVVVVAAGQIPEFGHIALLTILLVAFQIAVVVTVSHVHLVDVLCGGIRRIEHIAAAFLHEIVVADVFPVVDDELEEMLRGEHHIELVAVGLLHIGEVNPIESSVTHILHTVDDLVGILQRVLCVAHPEISLGKRCGTGKEIESVHGQIVGRRSVIVVGVQCV